MVVTTCLKCGCKNEITKKTYTKQYRCTKCKKTVKLSEKNEKRLKQVRMIYMLCVLLFIGSGILIYESYELLIPLLVQLSVVLQLINYSDYLCLLILSKMQEIVYE